jgi:glycogen operon protein
MLLSQGVPMILARRRARPHPAGQQQRLLPGQRTTWLAWIGTHDTASDAARLSAFVARLTALRQEAPALRSTRWWPAESPPGTPGIRWLRPDGAPMQAPDWNHGTALAIAFEAAATDAAAWLVLVNAGPDAVSFVLPSGTWRCRLATAPALDEGAGPQAPHAGTVEVPRSSLWVART